MFFLSGCQFNCPYCHNRSLLSGGTTIERGRFGKVFVGPVSENFLSSAVMFSGGEPGIHRDLADVIAAIRAGAPGTAFGIQTNGYGAENLAGLLPALDFVSVDIKAGPGGYWRATGTPRIGSTGLWNAVTGFVADAIREVGEVEVKTTIARPAVTHGDVCDIASFLEDIGFRGNYIVQDYVPSDGVDPRFRDALLPLGEGGLADLARSISSNFDIRVSFRGRSPARPVPEDVQ